MADAKARPQLKPVPQGVVELTSLPDRSGGKYGRIGADGGIVELKDGRLLLVQGGGIVETRQTAPVKRTSEDGGVTWSEATPLECGTGIGGVIRLQSGKLAAYGINGPVLNYVTSEDDGVSWSEPAPIPVYPDFRPMFHSLIQIQNGRMLLTGRWETEKLNCYAPDLLPITDTRWGWWRGVPFFMAGHRWPEMGICKTYYSDDEGRNWNECHGGLFGWFNEQGVPDGTGCITDVYEPTSAETADGRLLLFARSKRGRLVQAYSVDRGERWLSMQPTELASYQSPPLLIRIPSTGDLLCVWNQVSGEEIRRFYSRGRLSAAISRDSGLTWENFKTIEVQEGLEEVSRIAPEYPIPANLRGNFGPAALPDGFAMFSYPNVDIVGDRVFLRYARMWPEIVEDKIPPKELELTLDSLWPSSTPEDRCVTMTSEGVMRVYPLDWFYE